MSLQPSQIEELSAAQAIRAWTRRHSGEWGPADEAQLQEWLATAPEHRAAYDKVARLWDLMGSTRERFPLNTTRARRLPRRTLIAACAAALAVALIIPLWRTGDRWWNGVPVRLQTQRGQSQSLQLADGTQVLLDANSELVTKFGAGQRRVSLIRGEALFTVAHDASHPFEVEIGPGHLLDLGTRFDVETVGGAVRVTVLEGRVGVFTPHARMLLVAGSGGGYDSTGELLPSRRVDESMAVRPDGQRSFNAEPLSDIAERLARYHDIDFVFADAKTRQLRVSGTFRIGDLALFLNTLSAALPVEARWVGPKRIEFRSRVDAKGPAGH